MAIDLPDDLIELERSACAAIQADALTVDIALAVQHRIGAVAAAVAAEVPRLDVEMQLKKLDRHPQPEAEAA
ncbi:hypothetical protein [Streptomyces sp. KLOTTS4A1]|uniref:hypothetical protein n=1 Tax=Streptomyces sp. KLOTTS4A1 TaxID=3390996 RepID=UPI0039F45C22